MLIYVVLAAALALALACPCPPAPAAAEVCGSDLVTYPSLCHLQCAAESGLSLKHPGPCSPTEEYKRWRGCEKQRKCRHEADCGCGERDDDCNAMCRLNCFCGCARYPRGGMDHDLWEECFKRKRCKETQDQCFERCGRNECKQQCILDWVKCACGCQQEVSAPQRMVDWTACLERDQCHSGTCGECTGAGPICDKRCKKWCECNCAGLPRRDLGGEWEECFSDGTQTCEQAHSACVRECGDQDDCKVKCNMTRLDCSCDCSSATGAEWRLWDECKKSSECEDKTCKECQDTDCAERCRRNCGCRCLGINADSLDDVQLQECKLESGCETERKNCLDSCKTDKRTDCELSCNLALEKCHCECARIRPTKLPESEERVEIIQHCNFIN